MGDKKKFCFKKFRRGRTTEADKQRKKKKLGFADNRNRGLPHVLNCSFEGTLKLPEGGIIPLDHKA